MSANADLASLTPFNAGSQCLRRRAARAERNPTRYSTHSIAAHPTRTMQCTICLDSEGEVVQKGCCCRGDAGAAHIDCLVALATHESSTRADHSHWMRCSTCKDFFTGIVDDRLGKAWDSRVAERPRGDHERLVADCHRARRLCLNAHYAEAEALHKDNHAVLTEEFGPDDVLTVSALHGLSITYSRQGKRAEAEAIQTTLLAQQRRIHGDESRHTLHAMANLASTLGFAGKYNEAEELLRTVVEVRTRKLGPEDSDTLNALSNLAAICYNQGKYSEAVALEERLLAASRRVLGPHHPENLHYAGSLACTYVDLERFAEAEELLLDVIAHKSKIHGVEHPDSLDYPTVLAHLHKVSLV